MNRLGTIALACALWAACARPEPTLRRNEVTEAYCEAAVLGIGVVDIETDYLPSVVTCENGAAGFEALKAQAVAARSYLYYRLDQTGYISDSTGDQVYSCNRAPSALARLATAATSGQILTYQGTQVAGFYVAGAKQTPPACVGGESDPTHTEDRVTYNRGNRGTTVLQTALGFIHRKNRANRGAKSQNGAACLSDIGWSYKDILRFYYGEDIEISQAYGECITPVLDDSEGGVWPKWENGNAAAALAIVIGILSLFWVLRRPHRPRLRRRASTRRRRR